MAAYIEYHRADSITRLVIPKFCKESFPSFPRISYQSLTRPLLSGKNSSPERKVEPEASDISLQQPPELQKRKELPRYDSIIERLEKKYCGSHDAAGGLSDEDDNDEALDTIAKPRKKRNRSQADYYDLDDGFIDDSDNIAAIEIAELSRKVQTKHSGYFVSSGELEISDRIAVPEPSKKSENQEKKKKDSTSHSTAVASPSVATGQSESPSVVSSVVEDEVHKKQKKPSASKKQWNPPPIVEEAMSHLATAVKECTAASKGPVLKQLPVALDDALCSLDRAVLASSEYCDPSVHRVKSSVYLAALLDVLGGEVPLVSIKSAVTRLRSRDESAQLAAEVAVAAESLSDKIRERVKECPLPVPTAASSDASSAPSVAVTSSGGSQESAGATSAASVSSDKETEGSAENTDSQSAPPSPAKPASTPQWKWVCRWDLSLRSEAYDLEQLCLRWVDSENTFRSHLKAAHKRAMEESLVSVSGSFSFLFFILINDAFSL